jgi:hypothetical protein
MAATDRSAAARGGARTERGAPRPPSPRLSARELGALAIAATLLAVVMHWPLVLHLGSDVPRDLGDPLSQAWQVAWGGHALAHQPLRFFDANQFWPLPDSLAFSDALVGYAPAGLIGDGVSAAIARYDLLFLFAYALAFAGAYLLGRELGLRPLAASLTGAAFAYAPWRLEQDGHLHVLSSGGIPLTVFLLLRGYRSRRPVLVLAGWLVAAWQLAIGFSTGILLAYLLLGLGVLTGVAWWRRRPHPVPDRPLVVATAAGVLAFAAVAVVLARPYLRVLDDHPEARRSASDVAGFSGPVWEFLVAPEANLVWGRATSALRTQLEFVPEQTLFPGLAILVLAVAGLGACALGRRLRIGLGIAVVALAAMALGFPDSGARWLTPYWYLYHFAPGFSAIRVPGRMLVLLTLVLALLAGAGAQRALAWAERRRTRGESRMAPSRLASLLGVALIAAVLLEGSGFDLQGLSVRGPTQQTAPTAPAGLAAARPPLLQLPAQADDNRHYLLWSTAGFGDMVNGRSSFVPRQFAEVTRRAAGFPSAASVAYLRRLGVRTVVLHRRRLRGTSWAAWASRPVGALGLGRQVGRVLVLYDLRPR